jgi:hypothetical protein
MLDVSKAGGATRKDANHKRVNIFRDTVIQGMNKYLNVYRENQIYLKLLGTHSDYWRRGFGCKWGMSTAKNDNLVVSLMAKSDGTSAVFSPWVQ